MAQELRNEPGGAEKSKNCGSGHRVSRFSIGRGFWGSGYRDSTEASPLSAAHST
jgi:hypothetical protein